MLIVFEIIVSALTFFSLSRRPKRRRPWPLLISTPVVTAPPLLRYNSELDTVYRLAELRGFMYGVMYASKLLLARSWERVV